VGSGELRDLDTRGVLDVVVACRRSADRAEADLLAGVVHLVDLHPVLDPDTAAHVGLNDRPLTAMEAGAPTATTTTCTASTGPTGGSGVL
jgi:hypothetical protein